MNKFKIGDIVYKQNKEYNYQIISIHGDYLVLRRTRVSRHAIDAYVGEVLGRERYSEFNLLEVPRKHHPLTTIFK